MAQLFTSWAEFLTPTHQNKNKIRGIYSFILCIEIKLLQTTCNLNNVYSFIKKSMKNIILDTIDFLKFDDILQRNRMIKSNCTLPCNTFCSSCNRLWGRYYNHTHFTNEGTEPQGEKTRVQTRALTFKLYICVYIWYIWWYIYYIYDDTCVCSYFLLQNIFR